MERARGAGWPRWTAGPPATSQCGGNNRYKG